jgi:hypothetical protein
MLQKELSAAFLQTAVTHTMTFLETITLMFNQDHHSQIGDTFAKPLLERLLTGHLLSMLTKHTWKPTMKKVLTNTTS